MIDGFRGPQQGLLVLDGGDALLNVPRANTAPVPAYEVGRAVAMLRGLSALGLDGLAIGEGELALETRQLLEQARATGVPLLCANLQDKRGRPAFVPRQLRETGGVKVGLFALYEEPAGGKAAGSAELRQLDPTEAARSQVAALRKEGAELIVMLAHLGMARAREVAAAVPGIHLGLVAHTGWRTNEPEAVSGGKTFLVEAGRRGQLLAHLEVRLGEGWEAGSSLVDDSRRHVLYLETSRDLEAVRKGLAGAVTVQVWRDRIQPQLERARKLAEQLGKAQPPQARHSLISRLVELDETAPEQAGIKAMIHSALAQPPPTVAAPHAQGPRRRAR